MSGGFLVTDLPRLPRRPIRRAALVRAVILAAAVVLPASALGAGRTARLETQPRSRPAADAPVAAGRGSSSAARVPDLAIPRRVSTVAKPSPTAFDAAEVDLHLTLFKSGLSRPVLVTHAGDGSGRKFVVEQTGRIRVITSAGTLLSAPFIDLRGLVSTGGEQGLLGLAFHPRFETNGYFFVNYTNTSGDTIINRYQAAPGANTASRATGVRIMTIDQPYANHNGGHMAFGPDGYLYIGMGDGGSSGDPGNRAQSVNSLLGKMLRIDINGSANGKRYRIPSTNPYVGRTGLDEIWSRGLRNPWRWSFDAPTRRLFIGDVGQNRYEEIDRSNPSGTTPAGRGANYGWRQLEGRACYNPSSGCSTAGKVAPLIVYSHSVSGADNCSVTGGYVYRGTASPVLVGGYLYGDYCSGRIWVVNSAALTPASGRLVHGPGGSPALLISSFGQDEAGELYVCDIRGSIYRISAT
jgi:glucose/arabinose dehydrogenase